MAIFYSLLTLISLTFAPTFVHGTEGVGGQVNTGGKISFYEEKEDGTIDSSDSTSPQPDENAPTPAEKEDGSVIKPSGKLPSTGELVQRFWLAGLAIVLLVVWIVRKKTKGGKVK